MQHDYPAFLQRQVAIAVGLFSVGLSIIGLWRRLVYFDDTLLQSLADLGVGFVALLGVVFLLATYRSGIVGRVVQVALAYVVSFTSAATSISGDLTSAVFLGSALMLASEYGFLTERPRLMVGVPIGIYVAAFFYGVYRQTGAVIASVHTLLGGGLAAYVFVAIIRTRLDQVKDREIELEARVAERTEGLRLEVQRRAEVEEDLRRTVLTSQGLASERALLLHELHHRTKNDLQLIASMIRLHGEDDTTSSRRDLVAAAEDRIMAIALVHEYLYSSEELSAIGLADYLDGLVAHMRSAHSGSRITIRDEIETKLTVAIEPAIHLGLAVNELVQNARKHAFPDGREGIVTIKAREIGDRLEITVADDGVGMDSPRAWGRKPSIGMEIVEGLVSQLEGQISLERDEHTTWNLSLPAAALTARSEIGLPDASQQQ